MRVLIVKVSPLGDIVRALPVLDFLHQSVPGMEIDWVVEESFMEILEGNPLVAMLHVVRIENWQNHPLQPAVWRESAELRSALQARSYDIVFDLQGDIKSGIIARLAGCARRYGFDRETVKEPFNTRFINNQVPIRRRDQHVTDRSLRVVSVPFGKDYSTYTLKTDIHTAPEDDASAEVFISTLSDGLIFVLHHGSFRKTGRWHEAGWIDLGKRLLHSSNEGTILLSWGDQEEYLAAERIAVGIGRQTRILPRLSLKGFAALLKKVDLVVGGDCGPVHIAAAVGTPTVSLYRATDGRRNGPRGELHRIVQSPLSCSRCLKEDCERDADCRRSISADSLMQCCRDLLNIYPSEGEVL